MAIEITSGGLKGSKDIISAEETYPQAVLRHVARTGARIGETAVGLPGEIAGGLLGLAHKGEELSTALQEKLGLRGLLDIESPLPKEIPLLPTTETMRERVTKPISKLLPQGYLEPKTETEKISDAIVSDAVPLLIPIKGKIPFARALKAAGVGNLASWLTQKVGFGETAKSVVKMGSMLLANLGGPGSIRKFAKTLPQKEATEISNALTQSSKIHDFLKKGVNFKKLNPITAVMVGAAYKYPKIAATAYSVGYIEKGIKALSKSPAIRKYYKGALKAAAKHNTPLMVKEVNKLDSLINKQDLGSLLKRGAPGIEITSGGLK